MHVVVGGSVHYKELAVEVFSAEYRGGRIVSGFVLLRCVHVAFGVDGVVETPVGDGGNGHGCFERAVGVGGEH